MSTVNIAGRAERIRQLEDNIFAATGVRVIITLPTDWEIFIAAESELSERLSMDGRVSDWKDQIQNVFLSRRGQAVNTIGLRGRSPQIEFVLPRHAIVFIQPNGRVAHARTFIKDIIFNKEAV